MVIAVVAAAGLGLVVMIAAEAAWRGVACVWARLGPNGQLAVQSAGCMLGGRVAGDLGIIPDGTLAPTALGTGGVIGLVVMHRRRARLRADRGQQEWRQRGKANEVIHGGWQEYAASHDVVSDAAIARIAECERQIAANNAKTEAIFNAMADAAGVPRPSPRPHLTVVRQTSHSSSQGA